MEEQRKEFPYEIKDVEPQLSAEIIEYYKTDLVGYVTVGPKAYFFSHKYKECAAGFYNMPVRSDDIFVSSFPRSGTTWTQEMVWLIQNNLDYEGAKKTSLFYRFPFLDFSTIIHPEGKSHVLKEKKHDEDHLKITQILNTSGIDMIAELPSPRFIKTHLPLSLLPPGLLDKAKMIYVARDPRDVIVSAYHMNKMQRRKQTQVHFKTFWNYFMNGQYRFAPIFEHVKEAWKLRHHPNMLFIFYEELYENLPATVRKVATFLSKQYTEEQIHQLCDHLSFEKFKDNPSVNHSLLKKVNYVRTDFSFIRKGKVGGWREHFDEEILEQADNWFEENLRDTDLQYPTYTRRSIS